MHQLVEALSDLLGNQSIDFEYNLPKRLLILAFRFHTFPSFCFYETSALNILIFPYLDKVNHIQLYIIHMWKVHIKQSSWLKYIAWATLFPPMNTFVTLFW